MPLLLLLELPQQTSVPPVTTETNTATEETTITVTTIISTVMTPFLLKKHLKDQLEMLDMTDKSSYKPHFYLKSPLPMTLELHICRELRLERSRDLMKLKPKLKEKLKLHSIINSIS